MERDVELECRCGKVHGWLRNASPRTVNHGVCYCDDCQAYLHHLGRADLLDAHGGTEVVQVAPATIEFDRGTDQIAGVRLKPRGLYRWYARCCKTPLGNTLAPAIPFVGIPHELIRGARERSQRDALFGPASVSFDQFATSAPPPGSPRVGVRVIAHVLGLILGWKLRGRTWPHPFFDRATKAPRAPLEVLTTAERDALRPLCGPRPARA